METQPLKKTSRALEKEEALKATESANPVEQKLEEINSEVKTEETVIPVDIKALEAKDVEIEALKKEILLKSETSTSIEELTKKLEDLKVNKNAEIDELKSAPAQNPISSEEIEALIQKGVKAGLEAKEQKEEAVKAVAKEKLTASNEVMEYEQFAELKFMSLREKAQMKDGPKDKLKKLEAKVQARKGHMPKRSRTIHMGTGNGVIQIVFGYPVPEEIYQRFVTKGNNGVYFNS